MKILHVIMDLDPAGGGPPMIAFRLGAGQAILGHEVSMVCHGEVRANAAIDAALKDVPGREKVALHSVPRARLGLSRETARPLSELIRQHDVVHLHGVWGSLLLGAANEARRQKKPYFILLNGMLDPWSMAQKRLKKKIALALGYRRMLNEAAALHLGNIGERELIKPLGLRSPTVIIPNGIFFEEIEPLPAAGTFRRSRPELGEQPFILFLSRLHYKKGLDYLTDAFARVAREHRDARLVVAGPDGGAREDFERRILAAGISDRVHLVGPIYGPQKYAALVDAACFCLPSRQEGFSLAITEALGVGAPAIISRQCHFPEVGQAEAGEVLELDPRLFSDALLRVLNDPGRRQRMSQAGRELVRQRYTWTAIAAQTIGTYESATKGGV